MSKAKDFVESDIFSRPKTYLVGVSGRKFQFIVIPNDETGDTSFTIKDQQSGNSIEKIDVSDINTFITVLNTIKKNLKRETK